MKIQENMISISIGSWLVLKFDCTTLSSVIWKTFRYSTRMDKLHWSAFKTITTNLFVSRSIICDPPKTKRKEANHNYVRQPKQQQRLLYTQHIQRPHSSQSKSPANMNQISFYLESIILLVSKLWVLIALNIRKYYTYSMYVWMLIDQHDLL